MILRGTWSLTTVSYPKLHVGALVSTMLRRLFGQRLRHLRKSRNITQERLAEAIGKSVDFISLMERGLSAPSFDTLEVLAQALEVAVKDLFDF